MPEDLLPEMEALLADVTARFDRAVRWEEARQAMTSRLQAAAHAEVDDPLAHAAVSALCRRLVRGFAGDCGWTDIAQAGGDAYRREVGGDELAATMYEWQAQRERVRRSRD
jgi:hypothetical protein